MIDGVPKEYIIPFKPNYYGQQPFYRHCGVYSIKSLLSAYHKDNKKRPIDYYLSKLGRIIGFTRPHHMIKMLGKYKFSFTYGNLKNFSREEKIEFIKYSLYENKPIILLVGNGYKRNGQFIFLKSFFCMHWITIWGYNDETQEFYIYDSSLGTKKYDTNIPIGNRRITYKKLYRERSIVNVYRIFRYFYIKIYKSI